MACKQWGTSDRTTLIQPTIDADVVKAAVVRDVPRRAVTGHAGNIHWTGCWNLWFVEPSHLMYYTSIYDYSRWAVSGNLCAYICKCPCHLTTGKVVFEFHSVVLDIPFPTSRCTPKSFYIDLESGQHALDNAGNGGSLGYGFDGDWVPIVEPAAIQVHTVNPGYNRSGGFPMSSSIDGKLFGRKFQEKANAITAITPHHMHGNSHSQLTGVAATVGVVMLCGINDVLAFAALGALGPLGMRLKVVVTMPYFPAYARYISACCATQTTEP